MAELTTPPTTLPASMQAICIRQPGGPEVLRLEQLPLPVPGPGQMLVRVHAAAVNPIDWRIRSSGRRLSGDAGPYVPGFDLSGVVVSIGPQVSRFKPGDEIFAMLDLRRGGAYAEYAVVSESEAAGKPASASFLQAAAVPLVALTAWQALFDTAALQPGQTILIHGGAGGVGSMAVQLAKWKGATVIATASAGNHEFLRSIGADRVIDYRTERFEQIVRDVDVVLDTVGGDTQTRSFQVLRRGGILVSIVGPPSRKLAEEAGVRVASILVRPDFRQLAQIAQLIDAGQIKPVVSHVFPLSQAAAAHQQSETRHTRGKIVLEIVADKPQPATAPAATGAP
ncbi:NADP-dependent oxidoreductase [Fontivita pretiosa]|uniref:NADP-dependent oxidoreductase n=1 Tax=Fontivita pretiosa TaxID=2989684 RepID=UPI003D167B05